MFVDVKMPNNSDSKENVESQTLKPSLEEDFGYNFYPERGTTKETFDQEKSFLFRWMDKLTGSNRASDHMRCERDVIWCTENDPLVKLMLGALKSKGCGIKLGHHISCEPCKERCNGGYDPNSKQVVICENNSRRRQTCCHVLAHELTHAFDNCRAKVDFTNLEHVACTEIRASNFSHCTFGTAVINNEAGLFNYKEAHQTCVRNKALQSVVLVRNVSVEKAMVAVDKVFDQCYADLEPVGRIPRKFTRDAYLSYMEGKIHGYTDSREEHQ